MLAGWPGSARIISAAYPPESPHCPTIPATSAYIAVPESRGRSHRRWLGFWALIVRSRRLFHNFGLRFAESGFQVPAGVIDGQKLLRLVHAARCGSIRDRNSPRGRRKGGKVGFTCPCKFNVADLDNHVRDPVDNSVDRLIRFARALIFHVPGNGVFHQHGLQKSEISSGNRPDSGSSPSNSGACSLIRRKSAASLNQTKSSKRTGTNFSASTNEFHLGAG